ncbi:MAG: rod shape-determining protein MreD [Prevotella sp.]|nr:rod shape-determining protein MreD [Prevotella sp.]
MKDNWGRFIFYAALLIIQIVLSGYVNVGPYIYLCCLPLIVIYLPLYQETSLSMLIAFGCGLLVDILCDGIMGLNAAAAVALAAVRKPLFAAFFTKDSVERAIFPTIRDTGVMRHINFILSSLLVYFIVYICLDSVGMESFQTTLLRLVLSCAANLAIILAIDYFMFNARR